MGLVGGERGNVLHGFVAQEGADLEEPELSSRETKFDVPRARPPFVVLRRRNLLLDDLCCLGQVVDFSLGGGVGGGRCATSALLSPASDCDGGVGVVRELALFSSAVLDAASAK